MYLSSYLCNVKRMSFLSHFLWNVIPFRWQMTSCRAVCSLYRQKVTCLCASQMSVCWICVCVCGCVWNWRFTGHSHSCTNTPAFLLIRMAFCCEISNEFCNVRILLTFIVLLISQDFLDWRKVGLLDYIVCIVLGK